MGYLLFYSTPPVVNPTELEFAASADHDTLIGYELHVYQAADGTTLVDTIWLGHPASVGGVITLAFPTVAAGTYKLKVAAVRADGYTESALSGAFIVS